MRPAPVIPGDRRAGAGADSDCEGRFVMVTLHNKRIIVALFLIRSRSLYTENTTTVERARKAKNPVTIVLHTNTTIHKNDGQTMVISTDFPRYTLHQKGKTNRTTVSVY